ncbi:hypothetical protein SD457_09765 [Coprobacillaceae bacterium CR2/5/TPMF4]|nr:hypothetical protein SD457_09765 [Coprobacillaceae bacterium CR2/5/TPMF4]
MKLKELYKQTNNYQGYMEQLWQLVTKDKPGNLDIFKELKSLYSEDEWLDIREKYLLYFKKMPKLLICTNMKNYMIDCWSMF